MRSRHLTRRWTVVGTEVIHARETSSTASGGDRPVILLHGVGTTTRYFRPLLCELRGRVPAAAPELPGIGASSSERIPTDVAEQADVVAGWMRSTGRHGALVVGNSMGTQTAVELAIRHPDLVASLVLIGPTVDRAHRSPLRQVWKLLVDATVERPAMIGLTLTDSWFTSRRAVFRYARAAYRHHLEQRVPLVRAPILFVRGKHDPLAPRRWLRELEAVARSGRVSEVAGAAHACHHGRPRVVADMLVAERDRLRLRLVPPGPEVALDRRG